MLELTVLSPGLETYQFQPDGKTHWIVQIPPLLVSELGLQLAREVYPYLAHCWLCSDTLSRTVIEAALWEITDGQFTDERVHASNINTLLVFWDQYAHVLLSHFETVAPVKAYRDITGVAMLNQYADRALWTMDSSLLEETMLKQDCIFPNQPFEVVVPTGASKYF